MFCPTCGQQLSDDRRYCSGCGTRLDIVADYLSNPDKHLLKDRQSINGITLILITLFILLGNFIIFGATSMPHLTSRGFFFWLWIINILTAVVLGGAGLSKLIRSGFLRELKERDLRIQITELEQQYKNLSAGQKPIKPGFSESTRQIEPGSVTESTTRTLAGRQEQENK